jgi:hypothetical protein
MSSFLSFRLEGVASPERYAAGGGTVSRMMKPGRRESAIP